MTTPQITDEMRRTVLEEECGLNGHFLALDRMVSAPDGRVWVRGPQGQEPHLRCTRCHLAWIVVAEPGRGYSDASTRYKARLRPGDPATARP
jgi:hypothetical protein